MHATAAARPSCCSAARLDAPCRRRRVLDRPSPVRAPSWLIPGRSFLRRTSEFWYEDEIEFDAEPSPKQLVIVSAASSSAGDPSPLVQRLSRMQLASAFCPPSPSAAADLCAELWRSRSGPPLFRKARSRAALAEPGIETAAAAAGDAPASVVGLFLAELINTNWDPALDDGLGKKALAAEKEESLLLVAGSGAFEALLRALRVPPPPPPDGVIAVRVEGRWPEAAVMAELPPP